MKNERMAATLVGVLYIIGTVAGVASAIVSGGVPGTVGSAGASTASVTALLIMIMGVALALIPAVLFPIIKRESEALAVGYVIFRGAVEMLTYVAVAVCWMMVAVIGKQAAGASGAAVSQFTALGALALKTVDPILAVQNIVFAIGGLMLYYAMYRLRLVPRWLSGWGFAACVLYLAGGVIAIFTASPVALLMPLAVQEMVMAVWLIVKGFGADAGAARRMQPIAA